MTKWTGPIRLGSSCTWHTKCKSSWPVPH